MRNLARCLCPALVFSMCVSSSALSGTPRLAKPTSTTTSGFYRPYAANNIFNFFGNNGDGSFNIYSGSQTGFEFPAGSGKTLIYEEGVVWGGHQNGVLKVGGSTYFHGLQAGKILQSIPPVADDPSLPDYRIYRVRGDVGPSSTFSGTVRQELDAEAALMNRYLSTTASGLFTQYVTDWNQWPAGAGAPYNDVNHNSVYDPGIDIPGISGANQTLWYVANDLNPSIVYNFSGSQPIGIEFQKTIYGYAGTGTLGGTVFSITRIINKSGSPVDSMFIAQWSDPDLGQSNDDLSGCDTTLNLGFSYNSIATDAVYGSAVPAVGQALLQGPIVPGIPSDSAQFGGHYRKGYRNLPMSAFVFFVNGDSIYNDPVFASGGDVMWYNLLRGRISSSGGPFIDPTTGQPTKYALSGDPLMGTGWIDGQTIHAGDRRMALVSGPFNMAAGDTQEIVVATIAAQGVDRLNSVSQLKSFVRQLQTSSQRQFILTEIAAVDTLYPTSTPITLAGSVSVVPAGAATAQWSLASKPPGSTAVLTPLASTHVEFTPDVPGTYRVELVGTALNLNPDTAHVDVHVTTTQKPVVAFTISANASIGDTLVFDGGATHDPNSFPLTFTWAVNNAPEVITPYDTLHGYLSSTSGQTVTFVPVRAGTYPVTLAVSNGVFVTSLTQVIDVSPIKSANISVRALHALGSSDFSWISTAPGVQSGSFYFWGSIREFNNSIWMDASGVCAQVNFADFSHPSQAYGVGDAISWDASGTTFAGGGIGSLSIVSTDGMGGVLSSANFRPFLTTAPDTNVFSVLFRPPFVLAASGKPGILIYNATNPSSPFLTTTYNNGKRWAAIETDGNLLYGVHTSSNDLSVVNISSPAAISPVATLPLGRSYSRIKKIGQYFYLVKTNSSTIPPLSTSDTVAIYDFSNVNSPVLKGFIAVPKALNPNNRFNDISGVGTTIAATTAEGLYVFNVDNPALPLELARFVTGENMGTVFLNPSRLLAINTDRFATGVTSAGLLDFQSPFTNVDEQGTLHAASRFELHQNYPNPFNPSTTIRYAVPSQSNVTLKVYDILGREVATLVNEKKPAGSYQVIFDATRVASGVYFYRLRAGTYAETKKLLLIR